VCFRGPETVHPVELVRVAVVGFEEILIALPWGGALVAHDLERLDDRGCVNGFGMSGPDLDNEIFGAVRDGWFKDGGRRHWRRRNHCGHSGVGRMIGHRTVQSLRCVVVWRVKFRACISIWPLVEWRVIVQSQCRMEMGSPGASCMGAQVKRGTCEFRKYFFSPGYVFAFGFG
jgi:hypothetical protein